MFLLQPVLCCIISNMSNARIVDSLFITSGLVVGLSLSVPAFWWIVFPGVLLFLVAFKNTESLKQAVLGTGVTFIIKAAITTSVFLSVYPILWIDLNIGFLEPLLVSGYWLLTTVAIGASGFLVGLVLWWLWHFTSRRPYLFALGFPLVWLGGEVFGSFLYSLVFLGEFTTLNIVNSVGYVGYAMAGQLTYIAAATLGGVYALSLLVLILTVAWWVILERWRWSVGIGVFGLFMFFSILTQNYCLLCTSDSTPLDTSVALVDTTFGGSNYYQRADKDEYQARQIHEAVQAALRLKTDFILLPEDTRFTPETIDPQAVYNRFRFLNQDPNTVLIDSARVVLPGGGSSLRAVFYDGINKNTAVFDKQYLTPLGEYTPYIFSLGLNLIGLQATVSRLESSLGYRPGPVSSQAELARELPGVLFCFEGLDPRGIKKILTDNPRNFIVYPISHAWFHHSSLLQRQFEAMIRVQVVWSGVPVVSAGNMVPGAYFTPTGKIITPPLMDSGERWQIKVVNL